MKRALAVIIGMAVVVAWLPWRDPHFERVWFPQEAGAPPVERAEVGFRAAFAKPGTYRGRFTIVGGYRSNDVYPIVVTVTGR